MRHPSTAKTTFQVNPGPLLDVVQTDTVATTGNQVKSRTAAESQQLLSSNLWQMCATAEIIPEMSRQVVIMIKWQTAFVILHL